MLGLYSTKNEQCLIPYTDEVFLGWYTGSLCVYVIQDDGIFQIDYNGENQKSIYSSQQAELIQFVAVQDVIFFAAKTDTNIEIYCMYAPEQRLDLLYDDIPESAEGFLLAHPVSEHEICWSTYSSDFMELAAENASIYQEKTGVAPSNKFAYWGMLELDFKQYSAIRFLL